MERLALDHAHRLQIEAERERRARSDAELHVLPVLARGVVDDGPRLQADLAALAEDDAVARLPRRRLGHVRDAEVVGPRALQADLHVDEAVLRGRRSGGVGDGRGLAGVGVDDGEDLRKSSTLVAGDLEIEGVAIDARRPLEVGDPVAVNDDAAEGRVGVDEGRGRAAPGEGGEARRSKSVRMAVLRGREVGRLGRSPREADLSGKAGPQRIEGSGAYRGAGKGLFRRRARGCLRGARGRCARSTSASPRRAGSRARRRSARGRRAPSPPRG